MDGRNSMARGKSRRQQKDTRNILWHMSVYLLLNQDCTKKNWKANLKGEIELLLVAHSRWQKVLMFPLTPPPSPPSASPPAPLPSQCHPQLFSRPPYFLQTCHTSSYSLLSSLFNSLERLWGDGFSFPQWGITQDVVKWLKKPVSFILPRCRIATCL